MIVLYGFILLVLVLAGLLVYESLHPLPPASDKPPLPPPPPRLPMGLPPPPPKRVEVHVYHYYPKDDDEAPR